MIDLDNLPDDLNAIEQQINSMDSDELYANVHQIRNIATNGDDAMSEKQTRVGIMLVRRMRAIRETGRKATKAAKPAPPSLNDLLA